MKRVLTIFLLAAMLVTTVFPAAAQDGDPVVVINPVDENGRDNPSGNNTPVTTTVTRDLTISVGQQKDLPRTEGFTLTTLTSSNTGVATVDRQGMLTGVSAGKTTVEMKETSSVNGDIMITTFNVTVNAAATSASFDPTSVTLGAGETVTLKITHNGQSTDTVTYSVGNSAAAESLGGGAFRAKAVGDSKLYGTLGNGVKAEAHLTVKAAPGGLTFAATQKTLDVGQTFDLAPDLRGGYSSQPLTWDSFNTAIVTVSEKGVITAVGEGTTTVTGRTYNGHSTSCTVTVVKPGKLSLSHNQDEYMQGATSAYTALENGRTVNATLTSSNPSVVKILSNSSINAVAAGTVTITASYNGVTATQQITVRPSPSSVSLSPANSTISVGQQQQLTPSVNANAWTTYTYTVSPSNVATCSSTGLVTGTGTGTATITVRTHNGLTATAKVTVQAAAGDYTVRIDKNPLTVGESTRMTITDRYGATITASAYASSNAAVATIDKYGNIQASAAGQTTIGCSLPGGTVQQVTLTVQANTGNYSVWIEKNPVSVGGTTRVLITDRNGSYVTANSYSTSAGSVATVDRYGNIQAYAVGQTTISCVLPNGTMQQVVLTVQGSTLQFQAVPRSNTIAVGEETIIDIVSDVSTSYNNVTVTSSNTNIVRPDTNNPLILRGVTVGNAQVTVRSQSGKSVTFWMYVTSSSQSLVLNTGDRDMGVGETFQITPTDGYGNKNIACTFSSSAPQYVSVSAYGVVTAAACQGSGSSYIAGHAVITVRAQNGAEASFSVTTYPAPYQVILGFGNNTATQRSYIVGNGVVMPAGASINLAASVNAGSKSSSITFSTANSNVATVNQNGVLVGKSAGTTTVTARAYNGVSASMSVTITGSGGGGGGGGQGTARVVTASGSLNLREAPISGARIITTIPRLATVTVLSWGTVWSEIQYAGYTGYAMSQYLDYSPSPIYPTPTPTYWPGPTGGSSTEAQVTTISGSLNLRETPTIGGRILARIPQYAWISVYEKGATWCYVNYRGITGYVMTSYLTFSGGSYYPTPTPTKPATGLTAQVTTVSGSLNLRERAVVGATILTRIPQYALITVYEKGAQWSYVTYGGYVGYVMTGYLTFMTK